MTERVMNMLKTKFGEERLICWDCYEKIKVGDEVVSNCAARGRYKIRHKKYYEFLVVKAE
jgi:hypothetical protein